MNDVDIIIWPETAVQFFLEYSQNFSKQVAVELGKPLLLGARKYVREGNKLFNSAYILNEKGQIEESYDKKHLVPFGEYIPLEYYLKRIGLGMIVSNNDNNGITGFTVGSADGLLGTGDLPHFRVLICYESIFSNEVSQNAEGAKWLVHLTNDAWFGTYSGPQQHFSHAKARAIEQGKAIVRSANNGISATIDPYGRVLRQLDLNHRGFFDTVVPAPLDYTLYTKGKTSNWNTFLILSLIVSTYFLWFKQTKGR